MEKDGLTESLCRLSTHPGDLIAVTGQLGCVACAQDYPNNGLIGQTSPATEIEQRIKLFAHVFVVVSEGLLVDLGRMCQSVGVGASIALEHIPTNDTIKKLSPQWSEYVLNGAGDHQWCFTFSVKDLDKLPENCSVIGQITSGHSVKVFHQNRAVNHKNKGLLHFNNLNA